MEEELPKEHDVIVVGTGLVECVVAAAAARVGKKVLHIDKNDYYGVQWASFTLKGAHKWVEEIAASPILTPPGECDLEEGEQLVSVGSLSQDYSNVRQKWHIPKESPRSPSPQPSTASEDDAAKTNTQQPDVPDTPPPTPQDTADNTVQDAAGEASQPQPNEDEAAKEPQQEEEEEKRKKWSQDELMNTSRRFNLDLAPKLLYSRGPMVELLISSNIARYVEFKCISRVMTWRGGKEEEEEEGSNSGGLVVVPCSRSDVFTTTAVTLVEKRLLMKFLEFCHQYDRDMEQLQEHLDKPFVEFLRSRRLTDTLIHFVTEAIGMVGEGATCKEGLERTRSFLASLGRYGTTPFLFSMYGSGELPQAFCRLCAVFEGIYVLRKPVSSLITHPSSGKCHGLLSEGQRYTCAHLVMSASYAPREYLPTNGPIQGMSRAIFLTDRSIMPHDKEQLTLLRLPAKDGNPQPVTVIEVGPGTHVCPNHLYCVHMTCRGHEAESDLRVAVQRLLNTEGDEESGKPRVVWSLYFNQVDYSGCDLDTGKPENVHLCPGPNTDLDYDAAIQQARSIFSRMFPGEEFLPRAPDPEEIVFDNQGTEPRQGDTFSSDETHEGSKDDDGEEKEVTSKDSGGEEKGEAAEDKKQEEESEAKQGDVQDGKEEEKVEGEAVEE